MSWERDGLTVLGPAPRGGPPKGGGCDLLEISGSPSRATEPQATARRDRPVAARWAVRRAGQGATDAPHSSSAARSVPRAVAANPLKPMEVSQMHQTTRAARRRGHLPPRASAAGPGRGVLTTHANRRGCRGPVKLDEDELELIDRLVYRDRTAVSSALLATAGARRLLVRKSVGILMERRAAKADNSDSPQLVRPGGWVLGTKFFSHRTPGRTRDAGGEVRASEIGLEGLIISRRWCSMLCVAPPARR